MKLASKLFFITFLAILLASCNDNKSKWEAYENKIIDDYVKTLGDTIYTLNPSGLYYIELFPGTGISPINNDSVYFKYKASFLDFVVFNSTTPDSVPSKAKIGSDDLISGVDEGLKYMKEGGRAKLIIPSKLAYGLYGIPNIVPANTPILVTLELKKVIPGTGKQ
jgi:FKBP-type peptidyl-prolyl cis-trans isomerases 1